MPEFSRFKLEVGQLFWDGGSTVYCLLCTVKTASFLVDFNPPKFSFLQLNPPRSQYLKGEKQAVVKGPQHRHFIRHHGATERRHIFLCFEIRYSGKRGSRLVRIKLLIDLSMNTTDYAGPHKSGAAWKEERIEMNTCNGTSTIVLLN